uniref:hypothetical protein n=1 Tax=Chroothece richteriana TaxID=101928 RepID=UPI001FCE21D5|nr:hypothetical protein MW631_pgp043 [Chroothece richteriana]UNJ14265.1 hypothetical protein [Chroothece richteriana]
MIPVIILPFLSFSSQAYIHDMPSCFKLLILSDGSLTRHLQLILNSTIQVEIDMFDKHSLLNYHYCGIHSVIPGPRISRRIWLITEQKEKVVYAHSIWPRNMFLRDFSNPDQSIGNWLIESEIDVFKYIYKIEYVYSYHLEQNFNSPGPFWSRYYFLVRNGCILTSVQEVFSPLLS